MDVEMREELAEAKTLLETVKGPGIRAALSTLIASLEVERDVATPVSDSTRAAASGSQLPDAASMVPRNAPVAAPQPKTEGGVLTARRAPDMRYTTIERFAWDQGGYNSPKVSVYVSLDGVGTAKDRVSCSFSTRGFDFTVTDLGGKSYRLVQNNLDKDIVPDKSSFLVKKDKVVIKLQKTASTYGSFDHWTTLAAKKTRKADSKADPQSGLMDMMKDLYDDGDDSMKKVIGEAMMKQQRGEKPETPSFDRPSYGAKSTSDGQGLGSGGLGNFDDDLDLDLDKSSEDGGWGAGGKDDFGFGSAVPPPRDSNPVSAAADEKEEEEEEEKEGGLESPEVTEGARADYADDFDKENMSSLEALDD